MKPLSDRAMANLLTDAIQAMHTKDVDLAATVARRMASLSPGAQFEVCAVFGKVIVDAYAGDSTAERFTFTAFRGSHVIDSRQLPAGLRLGAQFAIAAANNDVDTACALWDATPRNPGLIFAGLCSLASKAPSR